MNTTMNTQTNGTIESSTLTRPLSKYERRHGLTKEMRLLKGSRRTRTYRLKIATATQEVQ